MDRERLGRVLGRGARLAARTAVEAVQAATAPEPVAAQQPRAATRPAQPDILPPDRRSIPSGPPVRAVRAAAAAATAAKAGMASPLKSASKALWHELTGSFFGLFAASFTIAVWQTRANAVSPVPADRYRFAAFCALALLFAYFSVSNFRRAKKRS